MSPKAMRVAIAEVCGFEGIHEEKYPAITYLWGYPRIGGQLCEEREIVPDYLNDLNAMHEAEKGLTPTQQASYAKHLDEALAACVVGYVSRDISSEYRGLFSVLHATAAQRCAAFLRTLGKYTP